MNLKFTTIKSKLAINVILIAILMLPFFSVIGYENQIAESKGSNIQIDIKTNGDQEQDWYKVWGNEEIDIMNEIITDSNDNIFAFGVENPFGDNLEPSNVKIFKINSSGAIIWNYSLEGNLPLLARSIYIDPIDGAIFCAFLNNSDIRIAKFNSSGDLKWINTDEVRSNYIYDLIVDMEGNIYLLSFGYDVQCILLVKYNSTGDFIWERKWGIVEPFRIGYEMLLDSENNVLLTGSNNNLLLLKYNKTGDLLMNKTYNFGSVDMGYGIAMDSNDNIFITGETDKLETNGDLILIKLNRSGDLCWNEIYGGSSQDFGYDIQIDSGNNIYASGSTSSYSYDHTDFLVLKYSNEGELLSEIVWGGQDIDSWAVLALDSFDNLYISGWSKSYEDFVLVKNPVGSPNKQIVQIPGYDTFVVFGLLSVITAILAIRECKTRTKRRGN